MNWHVTIDTWLSLFLMFGMQKVFGLDVFPDSVFELEGKYYLNKMNEVC